MSRLPPYVATNTAEAPQKSPAQKWAELLAISTILTCAFSAAHFLGMI